MKILFDHVDLNSTAGPHWFARKLGEYLQKNGHDVYHGGEPYHIQHDAQLSFVIATRKSEDVPLIQRLDGIYYDTAQNYKEMNQPIEKTYEISDGVIFQSEWSKKLVEAHFGKADNYAVIHNGIDYDIIDQVEAASGFDDVDKVWCCASSWFYEDGRQRYIKRLGENIRYFLEHSGENDVLCVAGDINDYDDIVDERIFCFGNLDTWRLMSLYKRADYFIHLGKFDNCPNVVIDARAFGCQIICSSLGGTQEIAGPDAIVIEEDEWDFVPFDYNVADTLDFTRKKKNTYDKDLSMEYVADMYLKFMGGQ